jgi:hypothetical protein
MDHVISRVSGGSIRSRTEAAWAVRPGSEYAAARKAVAGLALNLNAFSYF